MAIKKDKSRIVTPRLKKEEIIIDTSLRPKTFAQFLGQNKIKENLKILIAAAKARKEPLEHILLYGPAGLGKTTLASVIACEMKVNFRITSGPALDRAGDLASILTSLEDGDILFIDEIHRLNKLVEEILYPAMEDRGLDIIIGKGPSAKILRLDLPKFTIVGATIRLGMISSPLRDRFGVVHRLDFYGQNEIKKIILRSAKILGIKIDKTAATEIARCSRRTPRVANRLLKRIRDYAQVKADGKITLEIVKKALGMLGVDSLGLDSADRQLLGDIVEKFHGGPVGLDTLSAITGEDTGNIEEVYEPYLIRIGFLKRTPRGRVATRAAYQYLGYQYHGDDGTKKIKNLVVSKNQKKLL